MPLLDEYDVYEQLMAYWHSVMHDDVFLIMNEGWVDAARPRRRSRTRTASCPRTRTLSLAPAQGDQVQDGPRPAGLIVARYFADEQAQVDELDAEAEAATQAVEEYVEEHAGEEGLLAEAMDDDKITKTLADGTPTAKPSGSRTRTRRGRCAGAT